MKPYVPIDKKHFARNPRLAFAEAFLEFRTSEIAAEEWADFDEKIEHIRKRLIAVAAAGGMIPMSNIRLILGSEETNEGLELKVHLAAHREIGQGGDDLSSVVIYREAEDMAKLCLDTLLHGKTAKEQKLDELNWEARIRSVYRMYFRPTD